MEDPIGFHQGTEFFYKNKILVHPEDQLNILQELEGL